MDNEFSHLKLEDIIPNKYQPRESFDELSLNELAKSIEQHGVIQPIIVRKTENNKYEIVDGERRYKASLKAGLVRIPAIIRNYTDNESARVNLIDNLQRCDLSPIEEARAYKKLLEMDDITQEKLANSLGKSQSAVANKIRLLNLSVEVQEALLRNEISERHARSLLTVKDEKIQIELLKKVIEKRMTVRELDSEIKNMSNMFIPEEYTNNNFDNNRTFIPNMESNDSFPSMSSIPSGNQFINVDNNDSNQNDDYNQPSGVFIPNNLSSMASTNKFINNFDNINNNYDDNKNDFEPTSSFNNNLNSFDNYNRDNVKKEMQNNPFLTNDNYAPPMSLINNDNGHNDVNPFSSIRMKSQNNMMNYSTEMSKNQELNYSNDFDNSMNSTNNSSYFNASNNNMFINNEISENSVDNYANNDINNNSFSDVDDYDKNENPSEFDINDYKLPGVTYDDNRESGDLLKSINPVIVPEKTIAEENNYKYIEENPNYESVDKPKLVSSLDEVIGVLQEALTKIKSGNLKVDTEEIDFDDVYQIVIKVDKKGDFVE